MRGQSCLPHIVHIVLFARLVLLHVLLEQRYSVNVIEEVVCSRKYNSKYPTLP